MRLFINEVGPRDGLQSESVLLSTPDKCSLVEKLLGAGLGMIEVTSFVSARALPQMADAPSVARHAAGLASSARLVSLVINEGGFDRALACGSRAVAMVILASETFSRRNSGMDVRSSLAACEKMVGRARAEGVWTRVYLSAAWGCPYEGEIPAGRVLALAESILESSPDEIVLADSRGLALPSEVAALAQLVGKRVGFDRLALHLHDGNGRGIANAEAALASGVRSLDASVGGLGGCPFSRGAASNLDTGALALLAEGMGFSTGVDPEALQRVSKWLTSLLGRGSEGGHEPKGRTSARNH